MKGEESDTGQHPASWFDIPQEEDQPANCLAYQLWEKETVAIQVIWVQEGIYYHAYENGKIGAISRNQYAMAKTYYKL